jgi:beta-N-acetylhexosaminidase
MELKIYGTCLLAAAFFVFGFSGQRGPTGTESSLRCDKLPATISTPRGQGGKPPCSIEKADTLFRLTSSQDEWVRKTLAEMTLRERIAQMIISNTFGEYYEENSPEYERLKNLCRTEKIGGFIFFQGTSSGYARLSNKLQELSEIPLLISADFERGTAMRVSDGTLFPNNMAIGATRNPELAYRMGRLIARESRLLGVHQNYSPVCDVNNNPNNPIINVRSFGEDPELVSIMSEMMLKGLQEGKVIATAKHFPGHGDTEIDSHKDLPILNFSIERLNRIELIPFKNAIDNGVLSVMVAHLSFPALEPEPNVPASLSEKIVNGLLVHDLGFEGLIVTDALNMKGITKYFSTSEVAVMCVKAGIDLILMPLDEKASIDAIEQAVRNGNIKESRIDYSVEKILKAKAWLGLNEERYVNSADVYKVINTIESSELSQQIADESITLVKDEQGVIPLRDSVSRIMVLNLGDLNASQGPQYFSKKVKEYYPDILSGDSVSNIVESASDCGYIIVAIYAKVKAWTGEISIKQRDREIVNTLASLGKKMIVISFGNPYLLKEFPSVPGYMCAYGDAETSISAALRVLSGKIGIKGKLPVSVTDEYRFGWGIER